MFERIFGDYMDIGVGMILSGVILAGIINITMTADIYHEKQLETALVVDSLQTVRFEVFYDNTKVFQPDVISAIMKFKGSGVKVAIIKENGSRREWNYKSADNEYDIEFLSSVLNPEKVYNSKIIREDDSTLAIMYEFTEETP